MKSSRRIHKLNLSQLELITRTISKSPGFNEENLSQSRGSVDCQEDIMNSNSARRPKVNPSVGEGAFDERVKTRYDTNNLLLQSNSEISKEQRNEILSRMFGLGDSKELDDLSELKEKAKKVVKGTTILIKSVADANGVTDNPVFTQMPVKFDSDNEDLIPTVSDRSCGFIKKNLTPSARDITPNTTSARNEERLIVNDRRLCSNENREKILSLLRDDYDINTDVIDSLDKRADFEYEAKNKEEYYTPRQLRQQNAQGLVNKNGSTIDERKNRGSYQKINPSGDSYLAHGVSEDKYNYDKRNTTYTSLKNPSGMFLAGDSPESSKIHSNLLKNDEKLMQDEIMVPSKLKDKVFGKIKLRLFKISF